MVVLIPCDICQGRILNVPSEYPTIQAAVDAAQTGDAVLVADGTYSGEGNRDIFIDGKSIAVISLSPGHETCIIDCGGTLEDPHRGFKVWEKNTVISGFVIQNGFADDGGAIYLSGSGSVIMDCTIQDNYAIWDGGGIAMEGGSEPVEVTRCTIRRNTCHDHGGGIYCTGLTWIMDCTIQDNFAIYGGGIYVGDRGYPEIIDCDLSGNHAHIYGGGLACVGTIELVGVVRGCTISQNQVQGYMGGGQGGGIYLSHCRIMFENSRISGNLVQFCELLEYGGVGGGISAMYSDVVMTQCVISGNIAKGPPANSTSGWGGGLFVGQADCNLTGTLIAGNSASYHGGGLYCGTGGIVAVTGTTVSGNVAVMGSGGVHCSENGDLRVADGILWGDTPDEIGVESGAAPAITYSDIRGGWEGEGNIDADPLFTTGPDGDYYLSQVAAGQAGDSPCLNRGSAPAAEICFTYENDPVCLDEWTTRTDEIPDAGAVDMGYHYLTDIPAPTPTPVPTETPTAVPTATPTAECAQLGVTLWMPADFYAPGDPCACTVTACNPGPTGYVDVPLFVILDVYGGFYFAPGFNGFDYYEIDLYPGKTPMDIVPEFAWPEGCGTATGILFYAAMLRDDMTAVLGEWDVISFGWTDR